jgi:hypothetical protein
LGVSARDLTRAHLEALLLARAVTTTEPARILRALDRTRVSPALVTILEAMIDVERDDAERGPKTKGQRALADQARAITVWELMRYSVPRLVELAKELPAREPRPRVSALDIGLEAVA